MSEDNGAAADGVFFVGRAEPAVVFDFCVFVDSVVLAEVDTGFAIVGEAWWFEAVHRGCVLFQSRSS